MNSIPQFSIKRKPFPGDWNIPQQKEAVPFRNSLVFGFNCACSEAAYLSSTNPFWYSEPKVQGLLPETLLDLAQCKAAIERVEDRSGLMSDGGDTIVTQQHVTKGLGARGEMAHRIGPLVEYQSFRRIPISSTFERVESKRAWLHSPDSFVSSTQCMI
jgi:hypothetical protein